MGTVHLLQLPPSVTAPSSSSLPQLLNPQNPPCQNPRFRNPNRCRSTGYGGRGGRSNWESNAEKTFQAERSRFDLEEEFFTDEFEDGFSFRNAAKKRVWWSDDSWDIDEDDDESEFGVLEESIGINLISKVFRAFGWMLPAVILSMLLGTGPNAFLMALALPLAQSALSLVADTLWGRSADNSSRPRPKTKKKPYARASRNIEMDEEEKEENTNTGKGKESYYPSWTGSNDVSAKKGDKGKPSFGGWDELDMREAAGKVPKRAPTQKVSNRREQKKGKLSSRGRSRETPLLFRLLIAIFPILGSWTRFL